MTNSSRFYYLGTDSNKILVVKVDATTGSLLQVVQEVSPVAPNPLQLKEGVYNGIATEWISRHPKFPLLYALTSYWNAAEARVTTFHVDHATGALTPLGPDASTRGFHAAHATFSPDGSLYVIAHHNDGKLVFFDATHDDAPLQDPCHILDTPEVVPGTRRNARRKDAFPGLPSLHHIQYAPNRKYLLTVDPSQDYLFTYTVDARGLPTSSHPTAMFSCRSEVPIHGWFQRLITQYVLKCQRRARKAVVHPNGKYVYVLYESINRLQVYSIDDEGTIDGTRCWQDVSTVDYDNNNTWAASSSHRHPKTSSWRRRWCPIDTNTIIGITLQLASELYVTRDGSTLLVANRGDAKVPGLLSRGAENSIRVFSLHEQGRVLEHRGRLPGISGPVRHFVSLGGGVNGHHDDLQIVAGVCQDHHPCLQTYAKKETGPQEKAPPRTESTMRTSDDDTTYELVGVANIPANVFCIAH